ncbi:phytoene desaturase family protein [Rhodoplanes sp. TEM]|uniref:Phytoene desaturase family protein n=1 Tax=Rhodoplanes tepidamans TaxID=200616 RepID=A0ABT5J4Q2_RHOTP|nr:MULTISPECIES: 1-hydroxycarotenoid 3,4-desaturase CrtD [Rhodoplanes]MDC7784618.1 phytoene desaturase family protein [Rhodoplanes tepidamans]MDC7982910.1 phytoene desaturase family protein [Rhodoplanes sp. TEM]MDQ0355846.1 1-hydroxycarotenoid 3,4-desaturase [Rhodoplanes tepidamans]
MGGESAIVVGAGAGGLSAALDLALAGFAVTVVETAAGPGGKMREVVVGGRGVDAGPTVFTMRWVFDELFAAAGTTLADELALTPLDVLARHAWSGGGRLDLHADTGRSADAIGDFAGAAEARHFRAFCDRAARIYKTLEEPFLRAERCRSPLDLVRRLGLSRLPEVLAISPFATLWGALGRHFRDPRLRQLFGRYATYCGSSPFLAPATLMLIAHVEQQGVWVIDGGMHRLAEALVRAAQRHGAVFRFGAPVDTVLVERGRAAGVVLAGGERLAADVVILNADVSAVAEGRFGTALRRTARGVPQAARSLSAVTWCLVAEADGFPLHHHTVFFSDDYLAEFDRLQRDRRLPDDPTVYVCAEDRDFGSRGAGTARSDGAPGGPERLLVLVNAPPTGDATPPSAAALAACGHAAFDRLRRCGLVLRHRPEDSVVTTPVDFHRLFPGTGGALYGRASHGWMASFQRPGSRTRIPGLYLAGGSTHPGPGVPMAALSGRLAAAAATADRDSTSRSRRAGICGGTSTR